MNTAFKLVVLALLGCACGPGSFRVDASGEASTDDSTTSASSSSSETSTTETSTTDTSTTETSTTETTDSGETNPFVPTYDVFESDPCDPFMQDCPDGEKCVPWGSTGGGWDATKCVPVMGDQAAGEPCTYHGVVEATDDCDATGMCWDVMDVDGEPIGTCTPFCLGTADEPECPEGSQCSVNSSGVINLCISICNPILQECNDGLACYWANNGFNCIFTTQDIPTGEPCGFINDCAEGNGCIATEELPSCAGSACCSPFCDLDLGDQPCDVLPGTACVPFFEQGMAPPGYENVGVCLVP
jgi:hypothetical protein